MIISDNLKLEIEKFALSNSFHFKPYKMKNLIDRMDDNFNDIVKYSNALSDIAAEEPDLIPGCEWILDNFYKIEEKDETFGKKDRKSTIISYYLMSVLMFLNSRMIRFSIAESREMLKTSTTLKIGGLILISAIVINVVSNNFLKESKTYNDYYAKMFIFLLDWLWRYNIDNFFTLSFKVIIVIAYIPLESI